jgi:tryptophan 2,3-dioxygenase
MSSVYYGEYLQLDKILNAQELESSRKGMTAHDEHLFIVIHQAYELWFKQIIFELESAQTLLKAEYLPDNQLNVIVERFSRVSQILQLLVDQIQIIETMTPLDFLDFRDLLIPASGFQSLQFRLLETLLGHDMQRRSEVEKSFFNSRLSENDKNKLLQAQHAPSLFHLIEKWLERMPFTQGDQFNFWQTYQTSVENMLSQDKQNILDNDTLDPQAKNFELINLESTRKSFEALFDEKKYLKTIENKERRLSKKATLSALFIQLYRDEPALNLPFRLLQCILDIDERLTTWRYRHAIMAQRILGTKIGTGGSSGHDYLKKTTENSRVFIDYFNMASFLIPRSKLPDLPSDIKELLSFSYGQKIK